MPSIVTYIKKIVLLGGRLACQVIIVLWFLNDVINDIFLSTNLKICACVSSQAFVIFGYWYPNWYDFAKRKPKSIHPTEP